MPLDIGMAIWLLIRNVDRVSISIVKKKIQTHAPEEILADEFLLSEKWQS